MTPTEAHAAAVACEQRIRELSTTADKLAKAHDLLSDSALYVLAPEGFETSNIIGARTRVWTVVGLLQDEIKALRAELSRLVTLASGSAP